VQTYLREEVLQEGLTRNLESFSRFLEAASFSQASVLNVSNVARECSIERKTVENYFAILEDLLIAFRLPPFTRKAERRVLAHPKFYFFDVGVYRALRPKGPLDLPEEMEGPTLETLVVQDIRATLRNLGIGLDLYYWRTPAGAEVDCVLYGKDGLFALEIKRGSRLRPEDLRSLIAFRSDYPIARTILLYQGSQRLRKEGVSIMPVESFLRALPEFLRSGMNFLK